MSTESLEQVVAPKHNLETFNFRFRKDKETGTQRPSIKVDLAVPNVDGLIEIITEGVDEETGKLSRELELLFDAISDTIRYSATDLINSDENITSANFPYDKVTWKAIAYTDRADRRSVTIPEELWKGFVEDYITIMPALTGKNKEQVGNAAAVYVKKLSLIKTNKPLLSQLKDQFTIYVTATKNGEQFSEIIELLNRKFTTYMEADDVQAILSNL